MQRERYDVFIVGAGLAGLTLSRQLLRSNLRVLLVDRRSEIPPPKQKVGEATVQLSAYYLARVLDLEEHLLQKHYLKYNLRFYWKTPGRRNDSYEDLSQSYIRKLSNIATYQLDRNRLEAEILRLNNLDGNFTFLASVSELEVTLSRTHLPHEVVFESRGQLHQLEARWVIDTSGRAKYLSRHLGLSQKNPIRHGASFFWVEGLLNVEKLTNLSPTQIRLRQDRSALGHFPVWLATNHFAGEGFWFWVIPLQGKTSLGLVYDNSKIPFELVSTPSRLIEWICREFPLFEKDLPYRTILDHSAYRDFSYDCEQTISEYRWAISGEAGRFTDPLYSPGGDLIALHNTLITDAILRTRDDLPRTARIYGRLMRSLYEAYVPSYTESYEVLGDQECFSLKYTWELAVYFGFYVFPFINDLFTNPEFILRFLLKFSELGRVNLMLQSFILGYYRWKVQSLRTPASSPVFYDFTELAPLRSAEEAFYRVGVSLPEAAGVLNDQLNNTKELARFIVAHIYSVVASDPTALFNQDLVKSIDLQNCDFDAGRILEQYAMHSECKRTWQWSFDPTAIRHFQTNPDKSPEICQALP
jgi:flavin-dependent dehydrogenase